MKTTFAKPAGSAPIGRPLDEDEPKDHVITIRTTRSRKNAYVKAAQKSKASLTEWMIANCDDALPEPHCKADLEQPALR